LSLDFFFRRHPVHNLSVANLRRCRGLIPFVITDQQNGVVYRAVKSLKEITAEHFDSKGFRKENDILHAV
jgi:hypothetical protein